MAYDPQTPQSYVFAPTGGGPRRIGKVVVAVVAAAAVLGGGAFAAKTFLGGEGEPTAVGKQPGTAPKKPALTKDLDLVRGTLKDMATAQESYRLGNDSYTTSMTKLAYEGLVVQPGVRAKVITASPTGYCIYAAGAGDRAYYYSSDSGRVSKAGCTG